jgi:hypothetical protein
VLTSNKYSKRVVLVTAVVVATFLLLPTILSSYRSKSPKSCSKVEDSLVYIRGERENGEETLHSLTGFVIAKEILAGRNRYHAITASHGLKGKEKIVFTATPLSLKKIFMTKEGEKILRSQNENKFRVDTVTPVSELDVSIISFNASHEIPIACVSANKAKSHGSSKLQIKGFVMCENVLDKHSKEDRYSNEFYYMHTGNGELLSNETLKEKTKSSNDFEKNFYLQMEKTEKNSMINFADEGTYIRHTIPMANGMSGSPIFDEGQQVVFALHTNEYLGRKRPGVTLEVDNCSIPPRNQHGYGIFMEKILSTGLPDHVRKHMNIFN